MNTAPKCVMENQSRTLIDLPSRLGCLQRVMIGQVGVLQIVVGGQNIGVATLVVMNTQPVGLKVQM